MKKAPPLRKRPLHTALSLLAAVFCLIILWLFAGMPSLDPVKLARENEQISLLESGTVLTTVRQKEYAYTLLRGKDGIVRISEAKQYRYIPFLFDHHSVGLTECDNLDGAAYFAEPNYVTEYAYLAVEDERAAKVVMDVTFTLDNREHAQTMYGTLLENGVFRLDLNEMLNLAQGEVYDRGDRMTYDRMQYWFAFPGHNGLRAFDSYAICVFDAEEHEIARWTA